MLPGRSFEDAQVAALYRHRPDYPDAVLEKLIALNSTRRSLLDLGCGTGKIARGLAGAFAGVTAVDASDAMLRIARSLQKRNVNNITWVHGRAESAPLHGAPFDLVVAAQSIHWMDQATVFTRLTPLVSERHVVAVVAGDDAFEPPWQAAWDDFLRRWIHQLKGEHYQPNRADSAFARHMTRYTRWIETHGELQVDGEPITQSVASFVACQHSRDTFAPVRLGPRLQRFDAELAELLSPYADDRGMLTYAIRTRVVWGAIRARRSQPEANHGADR
jgi:SAM-dependent methyltransferase